MRKRLSNKFRWPLFNDDAMKNKAFALNFSAKAFAIMGYRD